MKHLSWKLQKPLIDSMVYEYNKNTLQCLVKMNLSKIKLSDITYSPSLQEILGTRYTSKQVRHILYQTYTEVKLSDIYNFMVYTDIISSTTVGDKETPLLRVVPVKEGHWKTQHVNFDNIQYIPVSMSIISNISIYIYTDFGKPVPFTDGRTIVTLDFRNKASYN